MQISVRLWKLSGAGLVPFLIAAAAFGRSFEGKLMKHPLALIAVLLTLAACDGPAEQAGAAKDKAEAEAAGQTYEGDGPNERIGEARDRAADAAADARKAEAEAIEKEQDSIRSAADIEAERLEQQADAVRKAADAKAEAIKSDAAK
jgi:hypothetical protein